MAGDLQTERFGESVANEHQNQPRENDSPYAPVSTGAPVSTSGTKTGCGCWAYGCAGLFVGSLLLMVGLAFGGYWYLTGQVEKYTAAEPDQIPAVEMDEEAIERLQARIDSFTRQVVPDSDDTEDQTDTELEDDSEEAGDATEAPLELVLTANEINALLHSNESLRGMAHVVIEDGGIQAKVSIPADQVPGGKGRFFNADAEVEVSMSDGILVVKLVDANVKGEPLPDVIMQPMKEQNFAKEAYDDANTAELLRRFESIEVIDDAIHLRLKQDAEVPAEQTPASAEESPVNAEEPAGSMDESSPSFEETEAVEETPVEAPLPF